jgi:hypothetical protein
MPVSNSPAAESDAIDAPAVWSKGTPDAALTQSGAADSLIAIRAWPARRCRARLAHWREGLITQTGNEALSPADLNDERLLTLLHDADTTIAALREQGVRSPATSLYDLGLAGYKIERIRVRRDSEAPLVQYPLNTV